MLDPHQDIVNKRAQLKVHVNASAYSNSELVADGDLVHLYFSPNSRDGVQTTHRIKHTFDILSLYGTNSVLLPSGSFTYTCCNAKAISSADMRFLEVAAFNFANADFGSPIRRERKSNKATSKISSDRREC